MRDYCFRRTDCLVMDLLFQLVSGMISLTFMLIRFTFQITFMAVRLVFSAFRVR